MRRLEGLEKTSPEGWKILPAENICERVTDGTHDTPKPVEKGYYLITSKHIQNGKIDFSKAYLICENDFIEINRRSRVDVGDVLFSMIGTIGSTAIVKKEYPPFAIKNIGLFKINEKIILPDLLSYYFKYPLVQTYINNNLKGTTQKYITLYALRNFPVLLPPLETQHRIVSILEKAEETKKLRAQADELTNKLIQSVFLEMFGDPVTNPKGWEILKLRDVVKASLNGFGRRSQENLEKMPIVLRIKDIQNGHIDFSSPRRISMSSEEFQKYKLENNDFLYVRVNGSLELVGQSAIFPKIQEEVTFSDHIVRVRFNQTKVCPMYIHVLSQTPYFRSNLLKQVVTTAGQNSLGFNRLAQILIPVPPISLQQKLTEIIEKIEFLKKNQYQSQQQIDNLFNILMQKAFKGELTA